MTRRFPLVSHAPPAGDDRAWDYPARPGYALDWKTPCAGDQLGALGDKVYGLQFHPEITPHGFRRWQGSDWYRAASRAPGAQLRPNPDLHNARMDGWFRGFRGTLFGPAG